MKISKQQAMTRQIELVETYNICLSLKRILNAPSYDSDRWQRALYHALGMSSVSNHAQMEKIRQALGLP